LATGAQWVLHDAALVSAMGVSTSRWLGGGLLVAAGAYQFTGVKDACLRQCRSPLGFLLNEWRPGPGGAVVMGLRHGALCIGCCWALMALLFVLGVMNLWWIALVASVVLLEKIVPSDALTKALGGSLMVWGTVLVIGLV
jgi:predicted metal-binding membrane protein